MYPWSYCRKKTLSGRPWMWTAPGRGGACGFTTSSPVSTAGKRDDEIPSHVGWFCSFPTLDPPWPCESTVLLQITLGTWGGQCFESTSSLLTAYIPLTKLLNWKSSGGIAGQPLCRPHCYWGSWGPRSVSRAAEDGKEHRGQKLNSFASVLLCFKISSSVFIQNISLLIFLCAVFKVSAQ